MVTTKVPLSVNEMWVWIPLSWCWRYWYNFKCVLHMITGLQMNFTTVIITTFTCKTPTKSGCNNHEDISIANILWFALLPLYSTHSRLNEYTHCISIYYHMAYFISAQISATQKSISCLSHPYLPVSDDQGRCGWK